MKLEVVEEGTRAVLQLEQAVISIGRSIDNDIRLSGPLSSRHHCRIEVRGAKAWVVDLESANGTKLNEQSVERAGLTEGDVIGIGGASLIIQEVVPSDGTAGETQRIQTDDIPQEGSETLSGTAQRERNSLHVFARVTRALVQETELSSLLRLIVDSAVTLVGGERGFLLLDREEGKPEPDPASWKVRVARSFDQADIPIPLTRLSMGIAKRVVEKRRPLLSVDAGRDDRFHGMASVEDLRLRSVICLPIGEEGHLSGLLYVDNRLQKGAFTQEDLEVVELLGDQATIAIRNARFLKELRHRNERLVRSSEQIRKLNDQLGRKVRDRDHELSVVRQELHRERGRYDYGQIIGASDEMRRLFDEMDRVVDTSLSILIQGESGTGKELIARAIHNNGVRKDKPFVVENCAALPDALLESELFGHTRGAFTGADRSKKGLLEQAHEGTLFLDEIGDMSAEMQKKLLRVLQEGEVRPLGSMNTIKVDVRLLAATHRNLEEMVKAGEFREDLYYRINVFTMRVPPLRKRREDIPLLAEALLARAGRESGREAPHLPHEVMAALAGHDWPGNVRELENEMRRALLMAEDAVKLEHLSTQVLERSEGSGGREFPPLIVGDLKEAVVRFERQAILDALERNSGNKSRAAQELGISRFALQRKMDKYGLIPAKDEDQAAAGDETADGVE